MSATSIQIIEVDDMATVNVIVQGGIIQASSSLLVIGGFVVKKGTGNTAATIEIGDYCDGWIGDVKVSGKANSAGTPTDVSDLDMAAQGEIL